MSNILLTIKTTDYPFPSLYYVYLDKIYYIPDKELLNNSLNSILNKINIEANNKIF